MDSRSRDLHILRGGCLLNSPWTSSKKIFKKMLCMFKTTDQLYHLTIHAAYTPECKSWGFYSKAAHLPTDQLDENFQKHVSLVLPNWLTIQLNHTTPSWRLWILRGLFKSAHQPANQFEENFQKHVLQVSTNWPNKPHKHTTALHFPQTVNPDGSLQKQPTSPLTSLKKIFKSMSCRFQPTDQTYHGTIQPPCISHSL